VTIRDVLIVVKAFLRRINVPNADVDDDGDVDLQDIRLTVRNFGRTCD
jgi:hypothetical protein